MIPVYDNNAKKELEPVPKVDDFKRSLNKGESPKPAPSIGLEINKLKYNSKSLVLDKVEGIIEIKFRKNNINKIKWKN